MLYQPKKYKIPTIIIPKKKKTCIHLPTNVVMDSTILFICSFTPNSCVTNDNFICN